MNQIEKALRLAETLGGKDGLNCIAELDPTALRQARETMHTCRRVICCREHFGTTEQANALLREEAAAAGLLSEA